jgi:hypothetical protein
MDAATYFSGLKKTIRFSRPMGRCCLQLIDFTFESIAPTSVTTCQSIYGTAMGEERVHRQMCDGARLGEFL